jgi:hypothetical protein
MSRSGLREEELQLEGAVVGYGQHREPGAWLDPVVGQCHPGAVHDNGGVALEVRLQHDGGLVRDAVDRELAAPPAVGPPVR